MTECFVDTYFFLALLRSDAADHQRALKENHVNRRMVTSWFVLLELADHLCDQQNRHLFPKILDAIAADKRFDVVLAEPDLLRRGVALYNSRLDKDWSLTDCTSFTLMSDRGIGDALAGDHHFAQAGFRTEVLSKVVDDG